MQMQEIARVGKLTANEASLANHQQGALDAVCSTWEVRDVRHAKKDVGCPALHLYKCLVGSLRAGLAHVCFAGGAVS